jgi:hypothetical protein
MKLYHVMLPVTVTVGAALALHFVERRHQDDQLDVVRAEVASLSRSLKEGRDRSTPEGGSPPAVAHLSPIRFQPLPVEERPEREASSAAAKAPAERRPLEVAEIRDQLEAKFLQERGGGGEWTVEAQRAARTKLFAAMPETSTLRSVECRASMCRIETTHKDLDHYQQFMMSAFMSPTTKVGNGGVFSAPTISTDGGEVTAVSYLARDGEPIEFPEQVD